MFSGVPGPKTCGEGDAILSYRGTWPALPPQPHPLWVVVCLGRVRFVLSALLVSSVVNRAGGEGWPAPWPQPIARELEWWGLGGDGAGWGWRGASQSGGASPLALFSAHR